jgi:hypothetical protein
MGWIRAGSGVAMKLSHWSDGMEPFEIKHLRHSRADGRRGKATETRVLVQHLPPAALVLGSKSLIYREKSLGGTSLAKTGARDAP